MATVVHKVGRKSPWTVRWMDGGVRRSRAFRREADALAYCRFVTAGRSADIPTAYDAMQHWLTEVRSTCRQSTYAQYRTIARRAADAIGRETPVDRITTDVIAAYRDRLASRVAGKTVHNELCGLRAFFSFCCRRGWAMDNPVKAVRMPRYRSRIPRWLDLNETDRLIERARTAPSDVRAAVVLAVRAGLRLGDLTALRWSDVDGECITVNEGKSKNPRIVPMHDDVRDALAGLPRVGPYVFFNLRDHGRHRVAHLFGVKCRAWLKKNGFPVGLHGLRHSFGTHLAQAGATLTDLRQLMGHTSIQTTEIYLHSSPGRQADLIARIGQPPSRLHVLSAETERSTG